MIFRQLNLFKKLHQTPTIDNFTTHTFADIFCTNITLEAGKYNISCYGAQGGDSMWRAKGGKGTKIEGILTLSSKTNVTIRVGKKGKFFADNDGGGFPDGGNASSMHENWDRCFWTGPGGGSSSIMIDNKPILVAAGGSGAIYDQDGAPGGDFTNNFWCINENCSLFEKHQEFTNCPAYMKSESGEPFFQVREAVISAAK